eukprot:scaffold251871_cov14-Tisochrysis_lutea.AAC.1
MQPCLATARGNAVESSEGEVLRGKRRGQIRRQCDKADWGREGSGRRQSWEVLWQKQARNEGEDKDGKEEIKMVRTVGSKSLLAGVDFLSMGVGCLQGAALLGVDACKMQYGALTRHAVRIFQGYT